MKRRLILPEVVFKGRYTRPHVGEYDGTFTADFMIGDSHLDESSFWDSVVAVIEVREANATDAWVRSRR